MATCQGAMRDSEWVMCWWVGGSDCGWYLYCGCELKGQPDCGWQLKGQENGGP